MEILVKLVSPIVFVLTMFSCSIADQSLPVGWRLPFASEISDEWRKESTDKYLIVRADFNGDGVIDTAQLLVRKDGSAWGLFAFVSQGNRTFKTYLLDEIKGNDLVHSMGVKKVPPGLYRTACGKGYWPCNKGETPEIAIQYDAIDYFKIESANSYFHWDIHTHSFKRIWISD